MSNWKSVCLSELFSQSKSGEWGDSPDGINDTYILRAADFTKDCKLRVKIGSPRFIPINKLSSRKLVYGDILLEKSGGSPDQPVGRVVFFDREFGNYSFSNFLQLLRVDKNYDALWVYYLLISLYDSNIVLKYQQQTTGIINFKLEEYLTAKIRIPHCRIEQQKIAKVLSIIDNQIKQTQASIEKYTAIKQGLMSDLFSRGIDIKTGKLRPSYQQAPELYRESELGWIPKDWNAPLLDKFAKRNSGHTPAKTISEYWNGGIKWVSLADSNKLDKLYITATRCEVSQLGIQNSSAIELPKGTVILSRDAGIGKSAILAKRMAVSQHFMAWSCKKSSSNLFLYYWLQNMKPVFEQVAMGSTIPTIGLDFFKRLQIACPDNIEEQENIGLKLKELDLLILKFKNEKQKSQSQKQGLMQDLLTGKKSVDSLPDNILTPTSPS